MIDRIAPIDPQPTVYFSLTKDVPPTVLDIFNRVVNLPLWQYQILLEELDKFSDGPALRITQS